MSFIFQIWFFLLGITSSIFILFRDKKNDSFFLTSFGFVCFSLSFYLDVYSHLEENFSILTIYQSTHSLQPLLYRISSVWGSHSGSMLLWIWLLSSITFLFDCFHLKSPQYFNVKQSIIKNQNLLLIFFSAYTFFTSNPFLNLPLCIFDGMELNPVLQDIVLAIHPPFIYLGYLFTSLLFSTTISILSFPNEDIRECFKIIIKYARLAWVFLTLGISLGSWWAYYELGWGGFWFWDPVENASLLPWILLTALLHTNYQRVTLILSFLSFYSCVLGTFFVRSGLLDSVHSFASDQSRGLWILCFLLLLLTLFFFKFKNNIHLVHFANSHKQSHDLSQIKQWNIVFSIWIYITVLLGTFYPSIHQLIFQEGITLGPHFYHSMIFPIIIPMIIFMIFSAKYNDTIRFSLVKWSNNTSLFIGVSSGLLFWLFIQNFHLIIKFFSIPLIFLSILLILELIKSIIHYFRYTHSLRSIGFILSHFGFALAILGLSLWNHFSSEKHLIMFPGDCVHFGGLQWVFREVNFLKGPNYDSLYGNFLLLKDHQICGVLFPEKRHYLINNYYSTKVDIQSHWFSDIHAIIGDGNLYTGWSVHLYYYPFISFLWIGTFLLALGIAIEFWKTK